jgi:hypothetical protein
LDLLILTPDEPIAGALKSDSSAAPLHREKAIARRANAGR